MSFLERLWVSLLGHSDRKNIRDVRNRLSERPQLGSESFADMYFPIERRSIAQKLWEITKEHSVADITGVMPTDRFVEDLKMDDLDSMSLVELTIHLEKEFGITIPEGRLNEIRTFGDLVDEVCRLKGIK